MEIKIPKIAWILHTCKQCGSTRLVPSPATLKNLRRALGWNVLRFAREMDVADNSVARWLNGSRYMSESNIKKFCKLLSVERPKQ